MKNRLGSLMKIEIVFYTKDISHLFDIIVGKMHKEDISASFI